MNTKTHLITILSLAFSVNVLFAETVCVEGLYYSLSSAAKTATVTYKNCIGEKYNAEWNIKRVNIPSSITYHGLVYNVTSIGANAFCECRDLISVELPNGIKTINQLAFYGCTNLRDINIPMGVINISTGAFCGCENLGQVCLPSSLRGIGKHAFSGCKKLSSMSIPEGVINIESCAFKDCESLTSIDIPSSAMYIGDYAFAGCSSLRTVIIPSNIKSIGNYAFSSCSALDVIYGPLGINYAKANVQSRTRIVTTASSLSSSSQKYPKGNKSQPPMLVLEEKSLSFEDHSNNNRIDADEQCNIVFKIKNNGKGVARNCEVRIRMSGSTKGITCKGIRLPAINPGKNYEAKIPITSNIDIQNGQINFAIEVFEPSGWGVAPFDLTVATKAYDPPLLQVVDYSVASNSGKIRKMEPFTLRFNLQNTKFGDAKDVKVKLRMPENIFVMDGSSEIAYSLIKSGEVKPIQLTLAANNNYPTTNIPITIDIKEKYGKFAENKQLDIALNQATHSTINIAAKDEPQTERKEIKLAMIKSEVDRNIPTTNTKNPNTFVLIIANEHYSQVASVPFALNDGNIFREYCIKTLGIGEKHIKYLSDATGNQIKSGVNWLANLTEAFDEPQIIVYYAGHGIPDEANKSAYLLPVDGSGTDVTTGYKLDNLYATLGNMPASQITVFMDACFSGSKREDGMIASARGVALRVKSGVPQGNMVVFSAAQGDETAYPNREQQHGLFTYYLLKKLQETQGDIALKDLGDYITKQVSQQSLLLNSKKQTPCVTPSVTLGDQWQNWKLK